MKLNLIYYKCLLDMAIEKFVECHEDFFNKEGTKYVLGLNISKTSLATKVERCLDACINSIVDNSSNDDVFVVIGSCYPKDNLLLDFKDTGYFPQKLSMLIESKPTLKWLLAEKDIEIDIDLFNEVFTSIFNKRFNTTVKRSSMHRPKIVYVAHSRLDCYMAFKTVKWAYGSSNCCNVWKDKLIDSRQNFIAINDLISKYIHNKSRMNKSKDFKRFANEMKDYLDHVLCIER